MAKEINKKDLDKVDGGVIGPNPKWKKSVEDVANKKPAPHKKNDSEGVGVVIGGIAKK